jgi:hypothetical protein
MTTVATPGGTATPNAAADATVGHLFIIGCARSGTTLLQSFLAAHPAVLSFPETAVFGRLFYNEVARPGSSTYSIFLENDDRHRTLHRRTQLAYRHAVALFNMFGRRDLEDLLPIRSKSIAEFATAFVKALDRLTLDSGKSVWLEKTPENIRYVPDILGVAPGARFINILRDGRQNVAAMYDMSHKYADRWWIRYRDLDEAIEQWNQCARLTRRLLDHPDVLLVRHEQLRADPETVVREICRFAGLPFAREMIERRAEGARAVVTEREPWKADVLNQLRGVEDRFSEIFDAAQRAYVEARLEPIDF